VTFTALRLTATGIRAATQQVCEDLISILERAALLYVSPSFTEALCLASEHQPHLNWLLQSCFLGLVAPERYDVLIANAYHLLQAHLTRVEKHAVSLALRRAAAIGGHHGLLKPQARFSLLHLSVRLGMFTECQCSLMTLHETAQTAIDGIETLYTGRIASPPDAAAVHYTLAGFLTYHHRRTDLGDTLKRARVHLDKALQIQSRKLGPLHISTLCSQLVKAQVLLLLHRTTQCRRLLERQLHHTETLLTLDHPLAAKMLAVKARLHLKLGDEPACEALQQRVLGMRQLALGMHHEDTHRSAMDVYSRRRAVRASALAASFTQHPSPLRLCKVAESSPSTTFRCS